MKASIIASFATGAFAAGLSSPILGRQSSGFLLINQTLTDISGLVDNLNTAVLAYQSGDDVTPVTDAADAIVTEAEGAIPAISAGATVTSDDEVLSIASLVGNPLEPAARSVVQNLEAKKTAIEANSLCATAFSAANSIYSGTQDLGLTIAGKIDNPTYGQLAVPLIDELLAIIAEAQAAFMPSNCTDAGTTPPPDTTTSTSTGTTGTTTSTTTSTITYSSGYGVSTYPSGPYGNSTVSYGASTPTYGYSASPEPSSSYPASSGGYSSAGSGGSYPAGSAPAGSSPTGEAVYTGGSGSSPTGGEAVYTGGASAVAPAGALILAIAALFV